MIIEVRTGDDKMMGIFATECISVGQLIHVLDDYSCVDRPTRISIQFGEKHIEDKLGKYLNHGCDPNARMIYSKNKVMLFAIENIQKDDEILFDYNTTEKMLAYPFKCNCHGKLITGYE